MSTNIRFKRGSQAAVEAYSQSAELGEPIFDFERKRLFIGTDTTIEEIGGDHFSVEDDTLDDISDGTTYGKVVNLDLTANRVDFDKLDGFSAGMTESYLNQLVDGYVDIHGWQGITISDTTGSYDALTIINAGGDAIQIDNAIANGINITDAGADGIHIITATDTAIEIENSGANGILIANAGGDAIQINNATTHGLNISTAGSNAINVVNSTANGLQILNAGTNGILISDAGNDAIEISDATVHGINITDAGSHGINIATATTNAINIATAGTYAIGITNSTDDAIHIADAGDNAIGIDDSASHAILIANTSAGDGLHITNAFANGINIDTAGSDAIEISNATAHGILITDAGADGLHITTATDNAIEITNAGTNAIEIANAVGYGLHIVDAGSDGIQIDNATGFGIQVLNAGGSGVAISNATSNGLYVVNAGTNAIKIVNATGYGLNIANAGTSAIKIDDAGQYGINLAKCTTNGYGPLIIENAGVSGAGNLHTTYGSAAVDAIAVDSNHDLYIKTGASTWSLVGASAAASGVVNSSTISGTATSNSAVIIDANGLTMRKGAGAVRFDVNEDGSFTLGNSAGDRIAFTTGDAMTITGATLSTCTIDADSNTISNLEHGAEVDDSSSGVHGVAGSVVGTSDTQTLTAKTLNSPKFNEDVVMSSTSTELNLLDGVTGLVQADFTKLAAVTSSAVELNLLDGVAGLVQADFTKLAAVTSTDAELNILDNCTTTYDKLNYLNAAGLVAADLTKLADISASAAEINRLDSSYGISITTGNTSDHGLYIAGTNASKSGLYVLSAAANCVYARDAGTNGVSLYNCAGKGISINQNSQGTGGIYVKGVTGGIGIEVEGGSTYGIGIGNATANPTGSALYIHGSGAHGIEINSANSNGIDISGVLGNAINISGTFDHGIYISDSGSSSYDGIYIADSQRHGVHVVDADSDGVHVAGATGNGLEASANAAGVRVASAGTHAYTAITYQQYGIYLTKPAAAYAHMHLDPITTDPDTNYGSAANGSVCAYTTGGVTFLMIRTAGAWVKVGSQS